MLEFRVGVVLTGNDLLGLWVLVLLETLEKLDVVVNRFGGELAHLVRHQGSD